MHNAQCRVGIDFIVDRIKTLLTGYGVVAMWSPIGLVKFWYAIKGGPYDLLGNNEKKSVNWLIG